MFLPPKFTSKSDYLSHHVACGSWVSKSHKAYSPGEQCTLSPEAVNVLQVQLIIVHICLTRESFLIEHLFTSHGTSQKKSLKGDSKDRSAQLVKEHAEEGNMSQPGGARKGKRGV